MGLRATLFLKLTQLLPLPYQVIRRLTAKLIWPEMLSLSVITDSTKTSTFQNAGQKMLRQGFWEYGLVVMMVVVFLQYRVVRRMFLAVVLPDGFLVFVDATAMCWYFIWTRGTVIVTLVVYVEFEMWLAFIHLSKILWKNIPMLSVSDSVIHTDFVSTRFPHFVQLTHCYWW